MVDFLNKLVSIILVFIMLVLAPFLLQSKGNEMLSRRLILNDVSTFIDQVKDTASITEDDVNKLYLDCNSHGLSVDVTIKRLIRTEVTKDDIAKTTYYAVDGFSEISSLNAGDVIQVHIEEVSVSPARRLTYSLLKIDEGPFEFTLAGAVG